MKYEEDNRKPVYIRWFLTTYCNYSCLYCLQDHSRKARYKDITLKNAIKRPSLFFDYVKYFRRQSMHAFNNFKPSTWCRAFSRLVPRRTAITISGGEPFLDSTNFLHLLSGLTEMEHIDNIRIDTNGSFKARNFEGVDWKKVFLNVSYHPSMISLDKFRKSIEEKLNLCMNIAMVNYVMDPTQLEEFHRIKNAMDDLGVFVNANVYYGSLCQTKTGHDMYNSFVPEIDVRLKTNNMSTSGQPCFFPVFAYELNPTGMLNVGCFPESQGDFIRGVLPKRFKDAVSCPSQHCTCLDMYAFLKNINRAQRMNLLEEYVEECKKHRAISEKSF